MRRFGTVLIAAAVLTSCTGSDDGTSTDGSARDPTTGDRPSVVLDLTEIEQPEGEELRPGDIIALRADGDAIEWVERRSGRILRLDDVTARVSEPAGAEDVEVVATIDVGTDGEQRGLLGHAAIDGERYAAWTRPDDAHLVVGRVEDGAEGRLVWDGGGTSGGAVGGHLEADPDGRLVLGLGQLTDWARARGGGTIVTLATDGAPDQEPDVLSEGYTNPFAFTVGTSGAVWVADNAVGDDVERIGRGDLADRDAHARTGADPRAPSAIVELADGSLAICGFLDGDLRRWEPVTDGDGPADPQPTFRRGEILGPCLTGAALAPTGDVVTATADALVVVPV